MTSEDLNKIGVLVLHREKILNSFEELVYNCLNSDTNSRWNRLKMGIKSECDGIACPYVMSFVRKALPQTWKAMMKIMIHNDVQFENLDQFIFSFSDLQLFESLEIPYIAHKRALQRFAKKISESGDWSSILEF